MILAMRVFAVCAAASAGLGLASCQKHIEAPFDRGVCYHVVPLTGGAVRFNKVADNRPNLESCAAALEGMRERFLALGGLQSDVVGSYQGNFLFLGRTGVFTGPTLEGARWPALVRTDDGRLVVPSLAPQ